MRGAADLIAAWQYGGDVEAVLDAVDCREAASDLASVLAGLIALSGMPAPVFLSAVKSALVTEHLKRALSGAVR